MLESGVGVTLAGINWLGFVNRNKNMTNLRYLGSGVFGTDYAKTISGALIGLGLLSKIVPELHTTRTFEIPACATALLTESTLEIREVYTDEEVIYFDNEKDIVEKVKSAINNPSLLKSITDRGYIKVVNGGYDYKSIIKSLLSQIYGK
ncbi:MAG: glycosyltransferase family 1 protein [Saprospiraceae bacterium]|nr:glycosyltransferase family 1 protein [Saprospiraceae bacterium]